MSLCLVIQTEDVIFMSADSRESMRVDDQYYATGRQVDKIHYIGDKVIFAAGNGQVVTDIITEFRSSSDQSILNLQRISQKHKSLFIHQYGSDYLGKTHHADLFIGCFENGKSALYGLSSVQNFEIMKKDGKQSIDVACCGCHVGKATDFYNRYSAIRGGDVITMYQELYDHLSNEEIGGELTLYILNKQNIEKQKFKIRDSGPIKTAQYPHTMNNADEMSFYANGERKLWFDLPNENFMFSGHLEAASGTFTGDLIAVGGTFTGTLEGVDGIFTGDLEAVGGTFTGDLSAVGGTFTGTLQGVDGVFTGDLEAVGGTFTGTLVGVDGDFSGTITASQFIGGAVIGATIRTAEAGIYPQVLMDPSNVAFGVYADANNGIQIPAYDGGVSKIIFNMNGNQSVIFNSPTSGFFFSGYGRTTMNGDGVKLEPGSDYVRVPSWGKLYSESSHTTLQDELSAIWSALAGKANASHSHTVTLPSHNHGIAGVVNWGGTFTVS